MPTAILGFASRRTTVYRPAALARQSDAPGWTSKVCTSSASLSGQPGAELGRHAQLPGAPLPARLRALAPGSLLPVTLSAPRVPSATALPHRALDVGQLSVGVLGPETEQIAAGLQRGDGCPLPSPASRRHRPCPKRRSRPHRRSQALRAADRAGPFDSLSPDGSDRLGAAGCVTSSSTCTPPRWLRRTAVARAGATRRGNG